MNVSVPIMEQFLNVDVPITGQFLNVNVPVTGQFLEIKFPIIRQNQAEQNLDQRNEHVQTHGKARTTHRVSLVTRCCPLEGGWVGGKLL